MYMASFVAQFDSLRYKLGATITNVYSMIGTPLLYPARLVMIDNLTNADLLITTNSNLDQMVIPASTGRVIDVTSNTFNTNMSGIFTFPIGTAFYVKWIAGVPTNGKSVYISVIYGSEQQ